eukprot:gene61341-81772_t
MAPKNTAFQSSTLIRIKPNRPTAAEFLGTKYDTRRQSARLTTLDCKLGPSPDPASDAPAAGRGWSGRPETRRPGSGHGAQRVSGLCSVSNASEPAKAHRDDV